MKEHPLAKHLPALIYAISLVVMAIYTGWLYAMGYYSDLYIPMFMTMLLAALLAQLRQHPNPLLSSVFLLLIIYVVVLSALYQQSTPSILWLGLPITATFLLLPLWGALCISLAGAAVLWVLTSLAGLPSYFIQGALALTLLFSIPPWEYVRRRALLRASHAHDDESDTHSADIFKERLYNEFQRASVLDKKLAVLILHLPQLDIAKEQFGHQAQYALTSALCSEVKERCRENDLLGRAGDASFWLVLPDTSESGALLVRERLQRALSRRVLIDTGNLETRIHLCLPYKQESFERYMQRLETHVNTLSGA